MGNTQKQEFLIESKKGKPSYTRPHISVVNLDLTFNILAGSDEEDTTAGAPGLPWG